MKVSDQYMNNNTNINRQCMEKILSHLTKLICLTEFGDSKELSKYVVSIWNGWEKWKRVVK